MRLYALSEELDSFLYDGIIPTKISFSLESIKTHQELYQNILYLDMDESSVYTISKLDKEKNLFDWKMYEGEIEEEILYNPDTGEEKGIDDDTDDNFFIYDKITTYKDGKIIKIKYK